MSAQIARRQFNIAEYYRMTQAGILSEYDRVELINGEVIEMPPIGSRHAACVDRLNALLHEQAGRAAIVRIQNPIRLNDYSEPQPDVALLKPRADFYDQNHPTATDVFLVVEVAETSGDYDRNVKVPLYAQAGIPEVWLVDLVKDAIEIYSRPSNGRYQQVREVQRSQVLVSEILPHFSLSADAILA